MKITRTKTYDRAIAKLLGAAEVASASCGGQPLAGASAAGRG